MRLKLRAPDDLTFVWALEFLASHQVYCVNQPRRLLSVAPLSDTQREALLERGLEITPEVQFEPY